MNRALLQQALDVLQSEYSIKGTNKYSPYDVIVALEAELAKPEQKQECETCAAKRKSLMDSGFLKSPLRQESDKPKQGVTLTDEGNKPEQEPMSFQTWRSRQHGDPEEIGFLQALKHAYESGQYSVAPPRKEWVRLTDEEIDQMWRVVAYTKPYDQFRMDVARAIEAKLKEKNQ